MKEIRLRKLRLLNFKGIRNLEIDFEGDRTSILAANGKGKSTVYDAFMWLLFGKDRKGREASGKSSFGLKTVDADNNIIPRLPHEVEAVMTVDGETITLRRAFTEKWTKKTGESEETFDGNKKEQYYNDVPCSENEWKQKITGICPESTFRLITATDCFGNLKKEERRKMLIQMAGGVKDEEIAKGNSDFTDLLEQCNGKTLDELRKEVKAKKAAVKKDVGSLPDRIDECQRDMPEAEDWDMIAAEIAKKEAEVADLEDKIMSDAKKREEADNRQAEVEERLHDVRKKLRERIHLVTDKAFDVYRGYQVQRNSLLDERRALSKDIERLTAQVSGLESDLDAAVKSRVRMLAEYRMLKEKSAAISAERLTMSDEDFKCPTCGRTFEPDRIEAKQNEMLAKFEKQRKARLDALASEINENMARGRRNNDNRTVIKTEIESCRNRIKESQKRIEEINSSDNLQKDHSPFDATPLVDADTEVLRLRKMESEIATQSEKKPDVDAAADAMIAERASKREEISELQKRLFKRGEIDRKTARKEDLQRQMKRQNQELLRLEKTELVINAFQKAKLDAVEDRINSMFGIVRFRLFNRLVNGGEEEVCDAMLNGVPYSDCSHAERINMGLDIINAISRFEKVSAPIFIDNAESICDILPTGTQVIRLVVSREHDRLTIINR